MQKILIFFILTSSQFNYGFGNETKPSTQATTTAKKTAEQPKEEKTSTTSTPKELGTFEESIKKAANASNPYFGKTLDNSYCLQVKDSKELNLGTIVPTSGGVSLIGQDIVYGMELIFNKLNSQGGIKGNLIKLKTQDSENEIIIAKEQLDNLWQSSSTFFGLFGAELVSSTLEMVKKNQLCLLFPVCGEEMTRTMKNDRLINFRASVKQEIEALLTYSVTKLYRRKIAVFYEDSIWGEAGVAHAEAVLKSMGYKIHTKASYPANTVEIISAVTKIADQSPSAVLCIAHARPTYNFVIQALKRGLKNCKFLGLGEMVPIQEILQKSRGIELIASSVVPSPFKSKIALAEQYRQDMSKFFANKSLSQFFFEGYCIASIFAQVLKEIEPPFKLSDIMEELKKLKTTDFGGLELDFNPSTKSLSRQVWINLGKEKEWPMFKTVSE